MAAELAENREVPESPDFHLYGSRDPLIAMHTKKRLLQEGRIEEADKIKIGVIFEGGGHAVSNEVGPGIALFDNGMFDDAIDFAVGASGGALVMAYSAVGDRRGLDLFKVNCDNGFGDVRGNALRSRGRYVVDYSALHQTLERHNVGSGFSGVTSDLYASVFNTKTRELELINLKDHPDPTRVLTASSLMPWVGNKKTITVDGKEYFDGSLRGLPVGDIIEKFGLTHVLVLKSQPVESSGGEKVRARQLHAASKAPFVRRSPSVSEGLAAFYNGQLATRETLSLLWTSDVAVGIFAPTQHRAHVLTMEYSLLADVARQSEEGFTAYLAQAAQQAA